MGNQELIEYGLACGYLTMTMQQLATRYSADGWTFSLQFEPGRIRVFATHPHLPVMMRDGSNDYYVLAEVMREHVATQTEKLPDGWGD